MVILMSIIALPGCGEVGMTDAEYVERAKDYQDKGKLEASVIDLKNALRQNPNNPEARWLLGNIYLDQKNGPAAEKELLRAMELGVSEEAVKPLLGEALLLAHEYNRLLEQVKPANGATPQNRAKILRMHGDANLALGRLDNACRLYEQALPLDSRHIPTYWGLANCALAKKDKALARKHVDTALKLDKNNAESWVVLGDLERFGNNLAAARMAYSNALERDPNLFSALVNRMHLFLADGKNDKAKQDLGRIQKIAPKYFMTHYLQALLHYAVGETDDALDSVQEALKTRPDYPPAIFLLGLLQYDSKSYEQASRNFERYLQYRRGSPDALKILAATYLKLNQPDRAQVLLKPYLALPGADARLLALAGEAYLRTDNPRSALGLFEKAAELVPASAVLRTKIGLSRLAAGEESKAIEELEASSALSAKDYRADLAIAYYYLGNGQYDKALASVAMLEKKVPESPGTYNLKGRAYLGKNNLVLARKNFEKALSLKPTLISAAAGLAAIDLQEKDPQAARDRYQAILEKDPKNIPAMVGLADLAAFEKNEQEYLGWLERAAEVRSSAFVPRALLANYYLDKGEQRKALGIARDAWNARPDSLEALGLLGRMQLAAGEKENALATYTKLTSLAPRSASAWYHRAKAHAAAGDAKAARSALRKVLEIDPEYADGLRALSALETRLGNHDEALSLARELQRLTPDSPAGLALEGDVRMAAGAYAQAAQIYEKALAKGQGGALAAKLHQALLQSGDAKKADGMLLAWLETHPQDSAARAYLARSYLMRQFNRRAIEQLEILLHGTPDDPIALNNLAVLYQEEKDPRALETAEKAYRLNPGSPEIADTLGWILVEQNQITRGLQLLRDATLAAPKAMETRYHYAVALARSGDRAAAREQLQALLSSGKDFPQKEAARTLLERQSPREEKLAQ